MMMMTTPKAEQGESGASGSGYVVSGEWPPKMAYATTTSEEIQKGTPEFRADVSYLLLHSAQTPQKQDDKTRQLNYLIHWSTYAEKHFKRIEEQLQAVQANIEAVQTLLKGERKESKAQAEAALKMHSQNLSIREVSPYSFSNRQKTTLAYKDFYLMPTLQDPKEAGNIKMFQNQRYNRTPDVKKHVISFGSEIPILNIDSCPTIKVSEVIRLWTQHLHMVISQKRLSPEQAWRILPFTFSGRVANWWKFLPDTEKADIMSNDLSVLGNRIILEFQPNVLAHQSSDWLMFGKRKLKDLSQFEQYAEDYLNEAYHLGAHALQTIGMSFLASIPEALGNLVLEELSHKNMLVEQMNLVDLQQVVRQELKKLCYRLKANSELPKVGRNICRQIDGAEEHNLPKRFRPRFRRTRTRRPFKPYKFFRKRKTNDKRKDDKCFACRQKGHYANKCPNRAPRQIKMMFEVPEIEHDWDLIENEAEFEECLRNKNVFYLEEEDDEIKSIITDTSSEAAGHIYMVSKKGKEILITEESEPEPEEEPDEEEFNCKDEYCNTFAPTNTSPYEIIQENSSTSENSTSDSESDIEKGIYSDNEVPIAPQHQEKKAVSDKVAKALLDKGTIPINFWEFIPKTSLRNSEIKQIKKMSLADISVIIPVQIAADKTGKWKKGHAFIDTGANMNFCKKEMISDCIYYPEGTRVDTMNGERRLHNFALNVQVKIELDKTNR
ncbi:putative Polyprotein CP [Nymphaea thermarum]|nr:putative Polyprotein CP [Nymphaea thermarum]